jgi:hypothetical protein
MYFNLQVGTLFTLFIRFLKVDGFCQADHPELKQPGLQHLKRTAPNVCHRCKKVIIIGFFVFFPTRFVNFL